ncbi:hypothetical protein ACHAQJ_002769 [Trichoderma viride]
MAAAESGSSTVAADPAQASQAACLKACKAGDVNCQAHCIGVPSPDESQVNQTTACVAKCPQGNGSAAETQVYSQCVDKCINASYFVTSEGTPSPTGAAGGNNAANSNSDSSATPTDTSGSSQTDASETTGTDTGAAPTGSSTSTSTKSSSSSGTKTGSAAATSSTGAAPALVVSGGAIVGVVAALLAL